MTQHTTSEIPPASHFSARRSVRTQQGQTIVVALLTLLLLAFTGALFLAIVTRNLQNAARQNRTVAADFYAQAGIKFADDQLMTSALGADWRPAYTPAPSLQDPDSSLLKLGFSRYNIGNGRFLVRVTYDPLNRDATTSQTTNLNSDLGRYIKIESVGREGTIDPLDPTTFLGKNGASLNSELVAYKALAITDYARFETNPDNRSDVANIGVPGAYSTTAMGIVTPGVYDFDTTVATNTLKQFGIKMTLGAPDAYKYNAGVLTPNPQAGTGLTTATEVPGGGSLRSNGPIRFFGDNLIYLNRGSAVGYGGFDESVLVAGQIFLDRFNPTAAAQQDAALNLQAYDGVNLPLPAPYPVYPTNSGAFDTYGSAIRDGSVGANLNDSNGNARAVSRLEPPAMDSLSPTNGRPRYRDIALSSVARVDRSTGATPTQYGGTNPAQYGYGQVLYINNNKDLQPDSLKVTGSYTQVSDWLTPNQSPSWNAGFYNPPGAEIELGPQIIDIGGGATATEYGVKVTRTGKDDTWTDSTGAGTVGVDLVASFKDLNISGHTSTPPDAINYYDVVIYAEGNVRIHGMVSDSNMPVHLTIVTGATAYIDGNVLKGNPNSTIAILAHDYVCVNTTQFFAGTQSPSGQTGAVDPRFEPVSDHGILAGPSLFGYELSATQTETQVLEEFRFGITGAADVGTAYKQTLAPVPSPAVNSALYISGGSSNETADPIFEIWQKAGGQPFTAPSPIPWVSPTVTSGFYTAASNAAELKHTTYSLTSASSPFGVDAFTPQDVGVLGIKVNTSTSRGDFRLERAAVLPMDIRIEALLFAQTRSFFVIPGTWFNSDSNDDLQSYITNGTTDQHILNTGAGVANDDINRFPFYGQPVDLRITISGSVSEARPADISAQSDWMRKWGWIPQAHGSLVGAATTREYSGHYNEAARINGSAPNRPTSGLTIVYDPMAAYPADAAGYFRVAFDPSVGTLPKSVLTLPFTPYLPVCPGFVYSGATTTEKSLFP